MRISTTQKLTFLSLIVLTLNGVIGYSVFKSSQNERYHRQLVEHSQQVIYKSGDILSLAKDAETSIRGFIITGDSTFLEPYFSVNSSIISSVLQLKAFIQDNPTQVANVDSLLLRIHMLIDKSNYTVELRNKIGFAAASAHVSTRSGKDNFDCIRAITGSIQQEETKHLQESLTENEHSTVVFNAFSVSMFILMVLSTIFLLIFCGKYLIQITQKEKRAAELVIANKELIFQSREKGKRAAELAIANEELVFQNEEKGKRAAELIIANEELVFQNEEKGKRATELIIANEELVFQNAEKGKRAAELAIANEELVFQNAEKAKRAEELIVANIELVFQNVEKSKRAAELVIANKELVGSQEIAHYGNFEFDHSTGVSFWSEQLCKIFGLSLDDNRQSYESLLAFIHPDDRSEVNKITGTSMGATADTNFYHRIIRHDLTIRYLHVWQRIELTPDGQYISMHVIAHDITDEAANIIQLQTQNEQLREIAWIQSHNVRSPLAKIMGLARLLLDMPEEDHMETIQFILDSSLQLDKVIRETVNNTVIAEIRNTYTANNKYLFP